MIYPEYTNVIFFFVLFPKDVMLGKTRFKLGKKQLSRHSLYINLLKEINITLPFSYPWNGLNLVCLPGYPKFSRICQQMMSRGTL